MCSSNDESLHRFLSFCPFYSSFLPFASSSKVSISLPSLALPFKSFFFFLSPLSPPSSALASSLLLLCHHHNIWLTYVWAFTPCQLAGICTHANPHGRAGSDSSTHCVPGWSVYGLKKKGQNNSPWSSTKLLTTLWDNKPHDLLQMMVMEKKGKEI